MQAQLERIDFALEEKAAAQAQAQPPTVGADAQSASEASQIPEGVTFDGTRTIPIAIYC